MALSDYDTAAWDFNGKPCSGLLENPMTRSAVKIYKNKLYIESPKEWNEGMSYIEPTIAELWFGDLSISGLTIRAIRGPQNSVFVFVRYNEGKKTKYRTRVAGGIGAVGFTDVRPGVLKRAGIKNPNLEEWVSGSSYVTGDKPRHMVSRITKSGFIKNIYHNSHSRYVGVTRATKEAFFAWAKKEVENSPEGLAWLDKAKKNSLRFNQGDAYFAKALKKSIPATKVGKAKGTVMGNMLRGKQ